MFPADGHHVSPQPAAVSGRLGMMVKFWEPGRVKTRLGRHIGMERAAAIHHAFFCFLTRRLAEEPTSLAKIDDRHLRDGASSDPAFIIPQRPTVVFAPPQRRDDFLAALSAHSATWDCEPQCDGDLGDRMSHWFQTSLHAASVAVLIGCDCPLVTTTELAQSFEMLRESDVVLGPALDGGYYLIGLAGPFDSRHQSLFRDMPWSTSSVLETTLTRIREAGMSVTMLEPRRDIDELSDLQTLVEQLAIAADPCEQSLGRRLSEILITPDASTHSS